MPAESKVDLDDVFDLQVRALQKMLRDSVDQAINNKPSTSNQPDNLEGVDGTEGWSGDLFDIKGLSRPFTRDKINERLREVYKEKENPGVNGDLGNAQIQIDFLAVMERAFRSRHTMRRPRAMAHSMSRLYHMGREGGNIEKSIMTKAVNGIKMAKTGDPEQINELP